MANVGGWDADGIMIRAAGVLGKYHAEQGHSPRFRWNTPAREKAYSEAYWAAKEKGPSR